MTLIASGESFRGVAIKDVDRRTDRLADELARLRERVAELEALGQRRELAEKRVRLQARLLDAVGQAVIVTDLQGSITYWNRAAEELYGWPAEEVVGRSIVDVTPSEEVRDRAGEIMAELREGKSWSGEFLLRRRDGTTFPAIVTDTPVYDEAGEVVGVIGVTTDITARKRSEETLRFRKALLEAQSEASVEGIVVVSGEREILSYNQCFRQMWGIPEDVLRTRSDEAVLRWVEGKLANPEEFMARVAYLYERPDEVSREEIHLRDGCTFERHSAPVRSGEGLNYGRVWFYRDVTYRKRMEQALARALREKSAFLADVSHELRTPLTVIRGSAEVGLELEGECAHREALEDIVREATRVQGMVEDLLFLARSDSGELPMDLEWVDVPLFLAELAGRAASLARGRGTSLELELTGEGKLWIDRPRVEQAVLNLIDNATKYGPAGELVVLDSATTSDELCIGITDNGPGIPEVAVPRIFERFYRLEKELASEHGGAGLGLPIAKTIAEAHGGRIEVASAPGEGTRMSLYLPLTGEAP